MCLNKIKNNIDIYSIWGIIIVDENALYGYIVIMI